FSVKARQLEETVKPAESFQSNRISNADVSFQLPRYIFTYTNTRVIVKFNNPNNLKLISNNYELDLIVNGTSQKVVFDNNGIGNFYYTFKNADALKILIEDVNYVVQPSVISIWYVISPLVAVLLFFTYRVVLMRKNKTPKLVVKRNLETIIPQTKPYESTLNVVKVRELEEEEL